MEMISSWVVDRKLEVEYTVEQILNWLDPFTVNTDLEVQERSVGFQQIFLKIQNEITQISAVQPSYQDEATENWSAARQRTDFQCLAELASLFSGIELNPVSIKAQRKVPVPEGLELDTPFYIISTLTWPKLHLDEPKPKPNPIPVTPARQRQHLDRIRDDPFYILTEADRAAVSRSATPASTEDDLDTIPIVQFDGGTNLITPLAKVRKKKKKAREIVLDETPVDIAADEMPENATLSDTEVEVKKPETRRLGSNILSNAAAKVLESIDFEEEERLEKEAIEADRAARQSRATIAAEVPEEALVVERVKKKKKKRKDGSTETGRKVKKEKIPEK
jgi:AP-3 complex subunit delta